MITFEENHIGKWKIEQEIMNSNPVYNLLSKNKKSIDYDDICLEYKESEHLGTTRLLVKKDERYIGLVDYCLHNPKDGTPWISLFIVHKSFQGVGDSITAYKQMEQLIMKENQTKLRLAVHKENEKELIFWNKMEYKLFKEVEFEGKWHYCLEKEL